VRRAVRAEVHGRVAPALGALDALGDRAGDQVDAELACRARGPGERGPVDRLGAGGGLLRARQHRPLLGQHDERRAGRGGGAGQPVRDLEVAVAVGGRCELHGGGSHGRLSSPVD
jgi:hypothetical protein